MMGLFSLFFLLLVGVMVYIIGRGIGEWNRNNHSPVETRKARVVARRTEDTHHHDAENGALTHITSNYYLTFQLESGERMKFSVRKKEYDILIEGDSGLLEFQGTRFLSFTGKF